MKIKWLSLYIYCWLFSFSGVVLMQITWIATNLTLFLILSHAPGNKISGVWWRFGSLKFLIVLGLFVEMEPSFLCLNQKSAWIKTPFGILKISKLFSDMNNIIGNILKWNTLQKQFQHIRWGESHQLRMIIALICIHTTCQQRDYYHRTIN